LNEETEFSCGTLTFTSLTTGFPQSMNWCTSNYYTTGKAQVQSQASVYGIYGHKVVFG